MVGLALQIRILLESFDALREGVLVQLRHLFAYASKSSLPDECLLVDPRFDLVTRGSAKAFTDLNGRRAVPAIMMGKYDIKYL